jgi:hypothetical protein
MLKSLNVRYHTFFLPFHMAFHRKTNDGIIEKKKIKTRIKWSVIWWMSTAVITKKIPIS